MPLLKATPSTLSTKSLNFFSPHTTTLNLPTSLYRTLPASSRAYITCLTLVPRAVVQPSHI